MTLLLTIRTANHSGDRQGLQPQQHLGCKLQPAVPKGKGISDAGSQHLTRHRPDRAGHERSRRLVPGAEQDCLSALPSVLVSLHSVGKMLTYRTRVLYYLPSHTTGRGCPMRIACVLVTHFRAKAEMLRHPHLKDSPVLIVDRDPSGKRAAVVDGFPPSSESVMGLTLGTGPVSPRERRRAGRQRAALPPGLRGGACVPTESERPRRGDGTRHGLCPAGRARKAVPRRGRSRLRPTELGARVPDPSRRRGRRQIPRLRRGKDVQDTRSD